MLYLMMLLLFLILLCIKLCVVDRLSRVFAFTFALWWFGLLIFSCFNIFDLYAVSFYSYALLILNVLFFLMGFLSYKRKITYVRSSFAKNDLLNVKLFLPLVVIGIIYIYEVYKSYSSLSSYLDMASSRSEIFHVGEVFGNGVELILYRLFSSLLFVICSAILASRFANKYRSILVPFSICYLLIYFNIGGGRMPILMLFIYFLFFYLSRNVLCDYGMFKNSVILTFVSGFKILLIVAVSVMFMSYVFMQRLGVDNFDSFYVLLGLQLLLESIVIYIVGPFRAFDYAITTDFLDRIGGFQFGKLTFGGLDSFVSIFLNNVGIDYTSLENIIGFLQTDYIYIGQDIEFNYAYTNVLYFYLDFGIPGIIVFSFLWGYFIRRMIFLFYQRLDMYMTILLCYLYSIIFLSVFTWKFIDMDSFLVISFLLILSRRSFKTNSLRLCI